MTNANLMRYKLLGHSGLRVSELALGKGFEFVDALIVIAQWGDRWTAGDAGPPVLRRHRACGKVTQIELRCGKCGEIVTSSDIDVEPGLG